MPLDYGAIDAKQIMPQLVTQHAVGGVTIPMLLTYSTKHFPPEKAPRNWADFWNIGSLPGQHGMYNGAVYSLEFALIADGVPKDKLYPLDVDRAFKSLEKIKSRLVWWSQMSQPGPLLASGEIVATPWVRSISFMLCGEPIGISYDGAALTFEAWVVPKGTKNAVNAMKFINFALQPKNQAELTKYIAVRADAARTPINTSIPNAAIPFFQPENAAKGFLLSGDYWGPNLDKLTGRWNEWQLS